MDVKQRINLVEMMIEDLADGTFFEYGLGGKGIGTKYLQRIGTPGNYKYIYTPKKIFNISRKARFYYGRFVKRASRFIKKLSLSYDATALNVKPVTWRTSIIDLQKRNGSWIQFHFDLKSHQIYTYKSKRGQGGASFDLSRAKKQGILRFR